MTEDEFRRIADDHPLYPETPTTDRSALLAHVRELRALLAEARDHAVQLCDIADIMPDTVAECLTRIDAALGENARG